MKINTNSIYYLFIAIVFLALKTFYTAASTDNLYFILYPTNFCIELISGSTAFYTNENGFFYSNLNFVINKSCSGFNFWIISFVMLSFLGLSVLKKNKERITLLFSVFIISYLSTLFVNASRIAVAILTSGIAPDNTKDFPWLHQAEGIFIYLSFLIILYLTSKKTLTLLQLNNEKLT